MSETTSLSEMVAEDVAKNRWFAYGTTPLGHSDYWQPVRVGDSGVLGKMRNFGDSKEISAGEYITLREHPLRQVGIFEFAREDEPYARIAYCTKYPRATAFLIEENEQKVADLRKENATLRERAEKAETACAAMHSAWRRSGPLVQQSSLDKERDVKEDNAVFIASGIVGQPLLDELAKLRQENDHIRLGNRVLSALAKVEVGTAQGSFTVCCWCQGHIDHPDGQTLDQCKEQVRQHVLTCSQNPLVDELAKLRAVVERLTPKTPDANGWRFPLAFLKEVLAASGRDLSCEDIEDVLLAAAEAARKEQP